MTSTATRGIGFRDDLIATIMLDRKTQTRRVIRPRPILGGMTGDGWSNPTAWVYRHKTGDYVWRDGLDPLEVCPGIHRVFHHGIPGDRLYIKEAIIRDTNIWRYRADGAPCRCPDDPDSRRTMSDWLTDWHVGKRRPYRSARFMPRWAARTLLEITEIRVERAQDITEADAIAEGFRRCGYETDRPVWATEQFARVWNLIHGPAGLGWDVNPWVQVYSFRRITSR